MSTTISTHEELAALPVGTQVLDRDGMPMTKIGQNAWSSEVTSARLLSGEEYPMTLGEDEITGTFTDGGASAFFPLTVLS
ncbi:hypothetical protein [Luteococcus sp.]|uniref:hypothetical protein n=1 Tax=Luteococcus sp. TaxID=1969402 RepID=UPI003734FD78